MNSLFAVFDVFPTAKGSTTRIAYTLQALKRFSDSLTLACLGWGDMPRFQEEDQVFIRRCLAMHPNFLRRTELFGDFLFDILDDIRENPDVVHFRDVWSGIAILDHSNMRSTTRKIFEVNGFPSIELPMHYPRLYQNPVLMSHIRAMEDYCLKQADHIITVSQTNANYIRSRQVAAEKITLIPNIAEINSPLEGTHRGRELRSAKPWFCCRRGEAEPTIGASVHPPNIQGEIGDFAAKSRFCTPEFHHTYPCKLKGDQGGVNPFQGGVRGGSEGVSPQFILYSGTLTPWQGITTLINAFALIADRTELRLILACSTKKFLRPIRKLIKKSQLRDRVETKIGLSKELLDGYYRNAVFTVAPLSRCDRNELQGCCPLKILESMAAGTPVIASNLAVCRELIEHGTDGWLVTPDSPRALAQAMLTLLASPALVSRLGQKAQQKIIHHDNQETFTEKLRKVYLNLS